MTLRSLLMATAILFSVQQTSAHAIWIATNPTGVKGKAQEVKLYFGEFSEKSISPAAHWFSDLKDFELLLVAPDRTTTKLSSIMNTDHYAATFTPATEGVYTLVLHHVVKDTYMKMKIDYNSSATVVVGNADKGNNPAYNSNVVGVFADSAFNARQNTALQVTGYHKGQPAAKQKIKVVAPNGWEKELYTGEKGAASFLPLWPGEYMIEYQYVEKVPGTHNGQAYDELWKIATYLVTVK